jgi:hypothetical protein
MYKKVLIYTVLVFSNLAISSLSSVVVAQTTPWDMHGPLRISKNKHFIEHTDGTGFFWLGCTAWQLPCLSKKDIDRYLEDRKRKGFTVIQFNATNQKIVNYNNEWPFVGEERPWNKVTFNESYWEHIDYIVKRSKELGLYLALFAWWGTGANDPAEFRKIDQPNRQFFQDPDKHNFEYGKLLGQRYNQEPNVIWVGSGEYHKMVSVMFPNNQRPLTDEHKHRLEAVIKGIKLSDPDHKHLYTIHPISFLSSSEEFHEADWLDFNMIQSHALPEFIVPLTTADYNLKPTKPTLNSEGWYENERDLFSRWSEMKKNNEEFDEDWEQRYQAYWSVFSGGIGFTYGHKNIWTMTSVDGVKGKLTDEVLNANGSRSLIYLKNLITSKNIQDRYPDADLLSSGTIGRDAGMSPDLRIATRNKKGTWAMVYSTRGSLIRVNLNQLSSGNASAYWFNPRNGKWNTSSEDSENKKPFIEKIKTGNNSNAMYFDPPGTSKDGNDWVLLIEVNK